MTAGGGELAAIFVNVVPSLAGSQEMLRAEFARLAKESASSFEAEIGPAMGRAGSNAASAFSAGVEATIGSAVGHAVLSKIMPELGAAARHFGLAGAEHGKSYVSEFEKNFQQMTPIAALEGQRLTAASASTFRDLLELHRTGWRDVAAQASAGGEQIASAISAKAVAANLALVETTKKMGGTMREGWYSSSKEATIAGDQLMKEWSTKFRVGLAVTGAAAALEFANSVRHVFDSFEHVGADAANALVGGFHAMLSGKMPDLMAPFNVLEEAAKASLTALPQMAEAFVPAMGLVKHAVEDIFPPLDALKGLVVPVMQDLLQVGDQYLGLQRKLAASTLNPEGLEHFSKVVQEIMASGAVVNFEDVADSIGRLNTNISGLSTEKLKELVTNFAMAEELVGKIDETKFAGIINAWKIPADEANGTLTMLTNTARATGIGINDLESELIRSGPAFRDLGYNAQQTAAFFGEMNREGEQGQRLILALMEADKKLNEEVAAGQFPNVKAAWHSLTDSVLAYENAGQHAAALNLLESHGISERVAPMLLEMLKDGKISAEDLGVAIQGVNQDITESVERSKDLGQTFKVVGQQIGAALAPVGLTLAAGLRDGGNHVTEWLKENQGKVAQWGADIAKGFLNIGTFMVMWFADTLKNLSPLFEAMKAGILAVTLPLDTLAHGMSAVLGGGWTTLADALHDVNGSLMNFDIGEKLDKASAAIHSFSRDTLPKWDAGIQAPVDDLKMEEREKKRGFKMWFEGDDDPAKVKVAPKDKDGNPINNAGDLVPPGETSLTFTPDPGWHSGQYFSAPPVPGFAFGGPTVQGQWVPGKDSIPAMLEVGEYVVRRDQAQKHRRELDAINYGYAGFDSGGEVDPGLRVLFSFLRGAASGFGLNLPKEKSGKDKDHLVSMVPGAFQASTAVAPTASHSGSVKEQAYQAMIAAGGKPSDFPAIDYIFQHESSWDVNAINKTDINAQHGDPSQGLGQLISGNYRAAGVDPNSKDAYQQTFAAVKYMQSRYGGIQQAYQYWQGHQNYAEGGHVGDGGGSWYGSGDHKENKGLTTGNLFHHFSKGFSGGGPTCSECGGAHPAAFHGGGIAGFAAGGAVGSKDDPNGPAFSQVIWSNTETGQNIGEAGGQWVGTAGSADPGYYHRGHEDFPDHTGHVHTTVTKNPFTGEPYNQLAGNADIRQGAPGFPPWVYQLGKQYGLEAATYPGHQVWNGINHGIDWYPIGKHNQDLSDRGYTHQDHVALTGFAQAVGQSAVGGGAPGGGWTGDGSGVVPQGTGGSLPGGPVPTNGGDGSAFNGGSFPPGSPIGPGGLIGPGYNPWTNPPPGLSPSKMADYTQKYEEWQLGENRRHGQSEKAQGDLNQATQDQATAQANYNNVLADATKKRQILEKQIQEWMSKNPGKSEDEAFAALDPQTAKELKNSWDKLKEANTKLGTARDTALQDQLEDQVGHPPPKPGTEGSERHGPEEGIASQLGTGLVKGVFQELGFPDVFGKPFTQWGIWKLAMGGLGFGINLLNNYADRAMAGNGGPFAGLAPGGPGFPGSLPGQFGGPLGTPPGPPPGSALPPAPSAPSAASPSGAPTVPQAPAQQAATKPQLHWDPEKKEWLDTSGKVVEPWRFQAPVAQGGLGGKFDVVPGPNKPAPQQGQHAPLQAPMGPAPHGADHWDPNKGWVDAQGNPVGTPGGGQGAPFGIPGLSNSLFGGGGGGDSQSVGGNNFMTGAFGGDYMKKLADKAPTFLVGMQDEKFRDKVLGGLGGHSPSSPNAMAGNMQNQGGNKTANTTTTNNSNVQFAVNNSGITTDRQLGKSVQNIVGDLSWPGAGPLSGAVFHNK